MTLLNCAFSVQSGGTGYGVQVTGGTVNINGTTKITEGMCNAVQISGGALNVNAGTIDSIGNTNGTVKIAGGTTLYLENDGTMTISAGTHERIENYGSLTISNGTIKNGGLYNYASGSIGITGGTFTQSYIEFKNASTATISGGTFKYDDLNCSFIDITDSAKVTITGGVFQNLEDNENSEIIRYSSCEDFSISNAQFDICQYGNAIYINNDDVVVSLYNCMYYSNGSFNFLNIAVDPSLTKGTLNIDGASTESAYVDYIRIPQFDEGENYEVNIKGGYVASIDMYEDCKLTVSGGEVCEIYTDDNSTEDSVLVTGGEVSNLHIEYKTGVTITGGTIERLYGYSSGTAPVVYLKAAGGTVSTTNGTFANSTFTVTGGTLNVTSGTFTNSYFTVSAGTMNLKGGSITASPTADKNIITISGTGAFSSSGGTITNNGSGHSLDYGSTKTTNISKTTFTSTTEPAHIFIRSNAFVNLIDVVVKSTTSGKKTGVYVTNSVTACYLTISGANTKIDYVNVNDNANGLLKVTNGVVNEIYTEAKTTISGGSVVSCFSNETTTTVSGGSVTTLKLYKGISDISSGTVTTVYVLTSNTMTMTGGTVTDIYVGNTDYNASSLTGTFSGGTVTNITYYMTTTGLNLTFNGTTVDEVIRYENITNASVDYSTFVPGTVSIESGNLPGISQLFVETLQVSGGIIGEIGTNANTTITGGDIVVIFYHEIDYSKGTRTVNFSGGTLGYFSETSDTVLTMNISGTATFNNSNGGYGGSDYLIELLGTTTVVADVNTGHEFIKSTDKGGVWINEGSNVSFTFYSGMIDVPTCAIFISETATVNLDTVVIKAGEIGVWVNDNNSSEPQSESYQINISASTITSQIAVQAGISNLGVSLNGVNSEDSEQTLYAVEHYGYLKLVNCISSDIELHDASANIIDGSLKNVTLNNHGNKETGVNISRSGLTNVVMNGGITIDSTDVFAYISNTDITKTGNFITRTKNTSYTLSLTDSNLASSSFQDSSVEDDTITANNSTMRFSVTGIETAGTLVLNNTLIENSSTTTSAYDIHVVNPITIKNKHASQNTINIAYNTAGMDADEATNILANVDNTFVSSNFKFVNLYDKTNDYSVKVSNNQLILYFLYATSFKEFEYTQGNTLYLLEDVTIEELAKNATTTIVVNLNDGTTKTIDLTDCTLNKVTNTSHLVRTFNVKYTYQGKEITSSDATYTLSYIPLDSEYLTYSLEKESIVYGDDLADIASKAVCKIDTTTYNLNEDVDFEVTYYDKNGNIVTPKSVGTYYAILTAVGNPNSKYFTGNYSSKNGNTNGPTEFEITIKYLAKPTTAESQTYNTATKTFTPGNWSDLEEVITGCGDTIANVLKLTNNTGIDAKTYNTGTVTLLDTTNYAWSSTNTAATTFSFTIDKLDISTYSSISYTKQFTYNEANQAPTYTLTFKQDGVTFNYVYSINDGNLVVCDSDGKTLANYMDAGTYYGKLTGSGNYSGTVGPNDSTKYVINPVVIALPTAASTTQQYTGNELTFYPGNWTTIKDYVDLSNNEQTNAGDYEGTVSLKDPDNYAWNDANKTRTDKTFAFTITKIIVALPTSPSSQQYTGQLITFEPNNWATIQEYVDLSDNEQTNAGDYEGTASLKDPDNYAWNDTNKTSTDKTFAFTITRIVVALPTNASSEQYTGVSITFYPGNYNVIKDYVNVSSNSQINVNVDPYEGTVALKDNSNYKWADETIEDKIFEYSITKALVPVPTDSISVEYNGTTQTFYPGNWDNIKAYTSIVPNTNTGKDANDYEGTVSLTDTANYAWDDVDKSITDKTYSFTILRKIIDYPTTATSQNYTGDELTFYPGNWETIKLCVNSPENNKQTAIGNYKGSVTCTDNYQFALNVYTAEFDYSIILKKLALPTAAESQGYTGSELTFYPGNWDEIKKYLSSTNPISDNKQTNIGNYTGVLYIDTTMAVWDDGTAAGTTDVQQFSFSIVAGTIGGDVTISESMDKTSFVYNKQHQAPTVTLTLDETGENVAFTIKEYYVDGGNTPLRETVNVAKYYIVLTLEGNFTGTYTTDVYEITQFEVDNPTNAADTTYTGVSKAINPGNWDDIKTYCSGVTGNTNTAVGTHTGTAILRDTTNYKWKNTTQGGSYDYTIIKILVALPTNAADTTYQGTELTVNPGNYTDISQYVNISNNKQTNVGEYTGTATLKDVSTTQWVDETDTQKEYKFNITSLDIDTVSSDVEVVMDYSTFVYNTAHQAPIYTLKYKGVQVTIDSSIYKKHPSNDETTSTIVVGAYYTVMTVSGNLTGTFGTYAQTGYTITKATVVLPTATDKQQYTGSDITFYPGNWDNSVDADGELVLGLNNFANIKDNTKVNKGVYTATLTLKDPYNYKWASEEQLTTNFEFEIIKRRLVVAQDATSQAYTASEIEFSPANYDYYVTTLGLTLTKSSDKAINVGDYTGYIYLSDDDYNNNCWLNSNEQEVNNCSFEYSVTAAEIEVEVESYDGYYDAQLHGLKVTTTVVDSALNAPTYQYSLDGLTWETTEIKYRDNTNGQITVHVKITATNHTPKIVTGTINVRPIDISNLHDQFLQTLVVLSADTRIYDGTAFMPNVLNVSILKNYQTYLLVDYLLEKDENQNIKYYDMNDVVVTEPTEVGTYYLKITGQGNFAGVVKKEFTIKFANIPVEMLPPLTGLTAVVGQRLADIDLPIDQNGNGAWEFVNPAEIILEAGTISVSVNFIVADSLKDTYTSLLDQVCTISVEAKQITYAMITEPSDQVYTGETLKPEITVSYTVPGYNGGSDDTITLVESTDYVRIDKNNQYIGEGIIQIHGIKNYTTLILDQNPQQVYLEMNYDIYMEASDGDVVNISPIADQQYTGSQICPTNFTVTKGGNVLTYNTDYTVSYENNVELTNETSKALAVVTLNTAQTYSLRSIPDVGGIQFEIVRREITSAHVSHTVDTSGKVTVTVKVVGVTLEENTHYTLSVDYQNNEYTVTPLDTTYYYGEAITKTFDPNDPTDPDNPNDPTDPVVPTGPIFELNSEIVGQYKEADPTAFTFWKAKSNNDITTGLEDYSDRTAYSTNITYLYNIGSGWKGTTILDIFSNEEKMKLYDAAGNEVDLSKSGTRFKNVGTGWSVELYDDENKLAEKVYLITIYDISNDGKVNGTDGSKFTQYRGGSVTLSDSEIIAIDTNLDGKISALEARKLRSYYDNL